MRAEIQICTRDRATELAMLLTSLWRQTEQNFDVVIVDSSQPQPLVNAYKFIGDIVNRLKIEGHGVKYIADLPPRGVCAARNRAVREGFGNEICIRIDDDSLLEQDYIARLMKLMEDENVGAAGGVVPLFGMPAFVRNPNILKSIFNKVTFSKDGDVTIKDDGGFAYYPPVVLPSHHLRSSYAFRRKAFDEVGGFPTDTGPAGWREETIFCMKLAWKGWKMLTDTGAICYHLHCPSGGVRSPDYAQQINIVEQHFKTWSKWMFKDKGNPYRVTKL